jgi:hypothetical protein
MKIKWLNDSKNKSFKPKKTSDDTLKKKVFRDGDDISLIVMSTGNEIKASG